MGEAHATFYRLDKFLSCRRGGFHIRPICGQGRYEICPYETENLASLHGAATARRQIFEFHQNEIGGLF